jgi:hypothetical protein
MLGRIGVMNSWQPVVAASGAKAPALEDQAIVARTTGVGPLGRSVPNRVNTLPRGRARLPSRDPARRTRNQLLRSRDNRCPQSGSPSSQLRTEDA